MWRNRYSERNSTWRLNDGVVAACTQAGVWHHLRVSWSPMGVLGVRGRNHPRVCFATRGWVLQHTPQGHACRTGICGQLCAATATAGAVIVWALARLTMWFHLSNVRMTESTCGGSRKPCMRSGHPTYTGRYGLRSASMV